VAAAIDEGFVDVGGIGPRRDQRRAPAELWKVGDAGRWPWIDQPRIIDKVVSFVHS
jgi:hypothetical protein